MGQGGSSEFKEAFQDTIGQLSEVQLAKIGTKSVDLLMNALSFCLSMSPAGITNCTGKLGVKLGRSLIGRSFQSTLSYQ